MICSPWSSSQASFLGSGWHRWPWLSNRRSLDTRCGVTRSCRSPWKQLIVSVAKIKYHWVLRSWTWRGPNWFCSFWSCFVAEDWIHLGNQRFPRILNSYGNSPLEVLLLLLYNALDLPVLMMKLYPNSKDAKLLEMARLMIVLIAFSGATTLVDHSQAFQTYSTYI